MDNEAFGMNIESSRLSRSGEWILGEKLYDRWLKRRFPVLWFLGKPGTGKTYLTSRILASIRQGAGLAGYFYIRESMNTQHTLEVILKTIAYQITGLHETYRGHAIAACKVGNNLLAQESIWESLFLKPFTNDKTKPLFVVIDGIDEATPENQPALSRADVEIFIRKRVMEISLLQKMRPRPSKKLKGDITKTLSDSFDGMFMLAKLMLAEVKDMNKPALIRKALAKPSRGLDDIFKRVITQVTDRKNSEIAWALSNPL
ncbi:hypothetical protein P280DRAFT_516107 [Massarina eburnea CBS 473.64]|uniref:Nephrocystin 3-like N-terminal domain-containing protein n=1 Tax=Massarina eburnea CBS 473.64 TaxID=1395130 RepID=A0A6A6S566_9PLEO|nr:hypothetical protein P280DRAFT_516107 [Massarina eburnea CBS 473.64]